MPRKKSRKLLHKNQTKQQCEDLFGSFLWLSVHRSHLIQSIRSFAKLCSRGPNQTMHSFCDAIKVFRIACAVFVFMRSSFNVSDYNGYMFGRKSKSGMRGICMLNSWRRRWGILNAYKTQFTFCIKFYLNFFVNVFRYRVHYSTGFTILNFVPGPHFVRITSFKNMNDDNISSFNMQLGHTFYW